jgi:hypothetical protein
MRTASLLRTLTLTALVSVYLGVLIEAQKKYWAISGWFGRGLPIFT